MKYKPIIHKQSSEDMSPIKSDSVHLIVTSPPYNALIEYDEYNDKGSYKEYIKMMTKVLNECYRVLVPGGRIAVNIANIGRKPYRPMRSLINELLITAGFKLRGEVIWNKWSNATTTAWGSFMSASHPYLRDVHEYIVVAGKGMERMEPPHDSPEMTITKDEWFKYTSSVWKITPANSKKHPAIYPDEIPSRLIKLYTWKDCIVLDPFAGIGTTLKVAKKLDRYGIGFEISEAYFKEMTKIRDQSRVDDFFSWSGHFEEMDEIEKGATM